MARRDKGHKEKESVKATNFVARAPEILQEIQDGMLGKAKSFREANTHVIDSKDEFYEFFKDGDGGFALTHFGGDPALEEKIKQDLAVTVRCIPLDGQGLAGQDEPGTCPFTGKPSAGRVVWAKSY